MISLPASPAQFIAQAVNPALLRLPVAMTNDEARVTLAAIALQESALTHRWQVIDRARPHVKGPARGLLQFELGSIQSRGGVTGVFIHPVSGPILRDFCAARRTPANVNFLHAEIETDDVLAAAIGRLLLWCDPRPLPPLGAEDAAWNQYLRSWRPGKPRPETWSSNYRRALGAITEVSDARA